MNKKTTGLVLGGSGLAALVLATALAQAGAPKHEHLQAATMDLRAATSSALLQVPGRVVEAEIEREDGQLIWEVEIIDANQQRVRVDLEDQSGVILHRGNEDDDSAAPVLDGFISLHDAISVVQAGEPGMLIEAELEDEDGTVVWEFEALDDTGTSIEFMVNATSGELMNQ